MSDVAINASPLRLRRNGKKQSCEPCRISKLACDHQSPCSRCSRQGKTCFFHPAPLTKRNSTSKASTSLATADGPPTPTASTASTPKITREDRLPPNPLTLSGEFLSQQKRSYELEASHWHVCCQSVGFSLPFHVEISAVKKRSATVQAALVGTRHTGACDFAGHYYQWLLDIFMLVLRLSSRHTPRFTGPTGHSAILLEHKALNPDSFEEEDSADLEGASVDDEQLTDCDGNACFSEAVRLGMCILTWLPNDRDVSFQALQRYFSVSIISAPSYAIYLAFHNALWNTYGHLLAGPRKTQKLMSLSRKLCFASSQRVTEPESTKDYIASNTGENSRFEVLGCLFVIYGATALLLPEGDPLISRLIPRALAGNKREFGIAMLECADSCLNLYTSLNDHGDTTLSLCLFLQAVCLQSVPGGDASNALWRRLGSLASAVTAAGLHKKPSNSSRSLLYIQTSRQLITSVFIMCSTLATFNGLPPPLSRHYVDIELPFDVSDEDLMDDDISKIENSVDEHGWNLAGNIHYATATRAVYINALIRDEILELSLGPRFSPKTLKERGSAILDRMARTFSTFPEKLRRPLTKENLASMAEWDALVMTHVQLHFVQHRFLLERFEYAGKDERLQLDAARELVNGCIVFWGERDRFPDHRDDVHWFLTSFGIPAASCLTVHLYQSASSPSLHPPSSHRAQIIQDLSVFVMCLEWTRPDDGNYKLCHRVARWIKSILDRVLSGSLLSQGSISTSNAHDNASLPSETVSRNYQQSQDIWPLGTTDFDGLNVPDLPLFGGPLEDFFMDFNWATTPSAPPESGG